MQRRVVKGILALIHRERYSCYENKCMGEIGDLANIKSPPPHTHTQHRCHESVDRGLLKSLLRMLVDLQVYQEVFEIEFLHETEASYRAEALRMMRDPEFTVSQLIPLPLAPTS